MRVALSRTLPDTAPCLRPGCHNDVHYRDTGPGPQPLYCSHRCRSMASNQVRRLEKQLDVLTDPALAPEDREERDLWRRRAALVRWHLARYRPTSLEDPSVRGP